MQENVKDFRYRSGFWIISFLVKQLTIDINYTTPVYTLSWLLSFSVQTGFTLYETANLFFYFLIIARFTQKLTPAYLLYTLKQKRNAPLKKS